MLNVEGRHPATQHFATLFDHEHLPPRLAEISACAQACAQTWIDMLPDGPELSAALRKMLEAKDCAVRARVLMDQA